MKGADLKRTIIALCALLAACAMLSGCESMGKTWDDTWTATKGYYKDYLNTDPSIDLKSIDYSSSEEKLAMLFAPVDRPLGELARHLNRMDSFPGEEWTKKLFTEFPWINGCVIATLAGDVVARQPEASMKPLNIQPFVDLGQEMADRRLRSYVDITPLGPEIYLATAMYKSNDLVGFICVHFDPRSLLKRSPDQDALMVLTPGAVVWPGSEEFVADALATEPWEETLKDDVSGTIDLEGHEYVWLSRYLGDKQLVYLTESAPEREGEEDDSFLWFF